MRKLVLMLAAAGLVVSSVPAFSQQTRQEVALTPDQKNECLLASKNCANQVDDIHQRIHKLDREIRKGTRVYTPAELRKLEDKLKETQDLLDDMTERGGGN